MLAYSTQGTLMAHHARKMDGLSTVMYRSLTLIVTLLPLLLLADWSQFSLIQKFSADFFWAGLTGAIASACTFWSMRFLPVGVGNVFRRIGGIVFAFILAYIYFDEIPLWAELGFVALILTGAGFLTSQKKEFEHLDNNAIKGIVLSIVSALFAAGTFFFITKISRQMDPYIAGYVWEVIIALFAVLMVFGRKAFGGQSVARISWKDFGKIALTASPTLIGTGCFLLAVKDGSFAIVSAIGAGGVLVSILLSHFLYHEKLSQKQLLWIGVIVIGIVGLKLVGG